MWCPTSSQTHSSGLENNIGGCVCVCVCVCATQPSDFDQPLSLLFMVYFGFQGLRCSGFHEVVLALDDHSCCCCLFSRASSSVFVRQAGKRNHDTSVSPFGSSVFSIPLFQLRWRQTQPTVNQTTLFLSRFSLLYTKSYKATTERVN